jgi:hypothetical protein
VGIIPLEGESIIIVCDLFQGDAEGLNWAKDIWKALEEAGAEVIVLGFTGYVGYAVEQQKRLDVSVVDSSIASLNVAELLVSMDLSHSRLTTPSPGLLGVRLFIKWPTTLRKCTSFLSPDIGEITYS